MNSANKNINFLFDMVFDESRDVFIFENTTKKMLDTLLDGCNCSVFAYGATGYGKTYTMLGAEDSPGVVWNTIRKLYSRVEQLRSRVGQSCEVTVAYIEVYNEKLRDLLRPTASGERPPPLVVVEDPSKGIVVSNLTLQKLAEADDLLELLRNGNLSRTQHATDANAESR